MTNVVKFKQLTLFKLFLIVFKIQSSISLKTTVEKGKDFCINKQLDKGDALTGSFLISGNKQASIYVALKGPDSKVYYENKQEKYYLSNGEFLIDTQVNAITGIYVLCFTTIYNTGTVVSFEFLTRKESGHLISLAKDDAIDDIYNKVKDVSYLFEVIEKNIKFFIERKETHKNIINDVLNTVHKVNIYKIIIILILSLLQIFIIKKLFRRTWAYFSKNKIGSPYLPGEYIL